VSDLMRIPLEGGGFLYVELAEEEPGIRRAARTDGVVEAAAGSLEKALVTITSTAKAALDAVRGLKPEEVEVEFGVRLNAQLGAVIAKTGLHGHMRVKLVWRSEPEQE